MNNITDFLKYLTDNFEKIIISFCCAALILFIGLVVILKNECRKQEIEENDTTNIRRLIKTFILAIVSAWVYMIISSYDVLNNSFILIVGILFVAIYLIITQNEDTDGIATSIENLSGASFFTFAIISQYYFLMFYIARILHNLIKHHKYCNKREINSKILSLSVKIICLIAIILTEVFVNNFDAISFELKLIIYSIFLVVSEIILPKIEMYILKWLENKMNI